MAADGVRETEYLCMVSGVIQDLPVSAYREFVSPLSLVPRSRIHCSPPHNVFGHLGCTIERNPEYMYTSVQNMGNK